MILPEDRPESPSKLAQPQAEQQQPVPEHPPPPTYEAAASSSRIVQTDPESQTVYVPLVIRRGEPARKRFCQAFCVAVIIYILLGALTSSIVVEVRHGKGWPREVCSLSATSICIAFAHIVSREIGRTLHGPSLQTVKSCIVRKERMDGQVASRRNLSLTVRPTSCISTLEGGSWEAMSS